MVKGSNRKMFRKPGMARRAIGILASSPELMQAANRNMPVRLQGGGSPRLEQINQTIQSIFGPNFRGPEQFTPAGAFDTRARQAAGQEFLRQNPVTPIDTQPFALNTDLPDQQSFFDMTDSELKQRQTELVAQLKTLEDRPGGKRKDPLSRQAVQEELNQISEARNQLGIMSQSKDMVIPKSGIGEIPLGINPDFEVRSAPDLTDELMRETIKNQTKGMEVQAAKEAELRDMFGLEPGETLAGPEEFFNIRNLVGEKDAPKTNPISRFFSPKTTNRAEQLVARKERTLLQALSSGKGVANARAEYDRALKGLEVARAGVDAYDEGTKVLETRQILKQRDQIQSVLDNPELPADLRKKLEADLAKLPDPNKASTDLTPDDIAAEPPAVDDGKAPDGKAPDGKAAEPPAVDDGNSSSQANLVSDAVEVGMEDAAAMSTVKEILADLGQPPELAEQPDIWHYITLAGLGIASGRSDDPLSNIADGVLVAFNQKTKDNKDFADNKYTRYLNDANLKIKEFELGLTAEQVAQGRIKAEAEAQESLAKATAFRRQGESDEATIKALMDEGMSRPEAQAVFDAKSPMDRQMQMNTLGTQRVKSEFKDSLPPRGEIKIVENVFGTFSVDSKGAIAPVTKIVQPKK